MTQIPVLNGIYTDGAADFRTSYPVNLVPIPKQNGISAGYLRPADGVQLLGTAPGVDRGGISWNGVCYRVMGTKFVRVAENGAVTVLGDVGVGGQVSMDYSFDRLAIASGGRLYYWNGSALSQVTDPDLGAALDVIWVDGYFMTTDGEFLVVTELIDPSAVDPLKYGSSEVDPDPVKGLLKWQNEVYAMNRHTIEVFDNAGSEFFPFQRIEGAQIEKGILGTHCACLFGGGIAFLGSGRNEAPAIYIGGNSQANKISTREIDQILLQYTESELALAVVESRTDKNHQHLWVHLPDRVVVFDLAATQEMQTPIWFVMTSGLDGFEQYPARNLVWCYDKWIVGDPFGARLGTLIDTASTIYGDKARWEFGTTIVYNEGRGAIFHQLELVCLTGRVDFSQDPTVSSSYSVDGETWSQEKFISAGRTGDRAKRLVWFQQGHMRNWRIQRFKGTSDAHISIARLEAELEPLAF